LELIPGAVAARGRRPATRRGLRLTSAALAAELAASNNSNESGWPQAGLNRVEAAQK
jgi:hypothetical protein